MNHRIPSSFAATLSTFALAAVVVAGCGQAFSLTGGTSGTGSGGNGGEGTTSSTTASVSASGTGTTTGSSSASSSSATSSGSGMLGCTWNPAVANPCGAGFYCDDTSCGKTIGAGTCKLKLAGKGGDNPVCGCDGLTYWNPLLAALRGMPAQHNVVCPGDVDVPCSAINACPGGGSVFCRKADKNCAGSLEGTCWVLPGDCNSTTSKVETCPLKDCVNECTLIKQGGSFDQSCGG